VIQVRKLRTADDLHAHLDGLGIALPFVADPPPDHAERYAILPMEGWDGTDAGRPTHLVHRRWQRFG
jgi:hypothetical protein